jgi:hypothetical protein
VFATSSNAFLGVCNTGRTIGDLVLAEKVGHKLIHAGIREQKVRRVRQQAGGRHNRVLLLLEKIEKGLPDFVCVHRYNIKYNRGASPGRARKIVLP